MNEATFRIFAGEKSVDMHVATEGVSLESVLEVPDGETLESSVFLREPKSSVPSEIRSFLTAMRDIRVVRKGVCDAKVEIVAAQEPSLTVDDETIKLRLPPDLIRKPKDRRRTLAGNLGVLYSLSLYLFEKKHNMVSYHSSALVDEKNKLVFINGGEASSGKSVIMLDYMAHYGAGSKYRVLSTEMGHFSIVDDELVAYTGSRFDNVSLFPGEPEKIDLMRQLFPQDLMPNPDTDIEVRGTDGSVKTAVSVNDYYASKEAYSSRDGYRLVYLMPTINIGKETKDPTLMRTDELSGLLSSLIGVARQKLGQKQPSWVYDERASLLLPVFHLAQEQDMEARTIERSLTDDFLRAVIRIQGNPLSFNKNPGSYWHKIVQLLDLE